MFKINPAALVMVAVPFGLAAAAAMAASGPLEMTRVGEAQPVPVDEATTLQLMCKFMPREARQELLKRFDQVGTAGVTTGTLFAEFVEGWNVVEDDGTPVVLSVASLDRLLANFEELGEQVLAQWIKACVEVRAKN